MSKKINQSELALRLSQGDRIAFRDFFMLYHPKVKAFCVGLLKSETDAEDLAQDIFVKIWNEREKLAQVSYPGSYIYMLTRNTLYNHFASLKVRQSHLQHYQAEELETSSPQDILLAKDLQLMIDLIVEQMPPQRQSVYRLSREQGLSNAEIAIQLNVTKKTVENHLNSALKELKRAIHLIVALFFC